MQYLQACKSVRYKRILMDSVLNSLYINLNNYNDIYIWEYFNICAVGRTYQRKNPFYSTAFGLLIMHVNNRFVCAIKEYQQQRSTQNST
jgi:hypothetical protein